MTAKLIMMAILTALGISLSACSLKAEFGYHGQTGRDDRVISNSLYPEGISQQRKTEQRY
jgi:hypothetical protein